MPSVETTFTLTFTPEQYQKAVEYFEDMKRHPAREYRMGKEEKSDEELIYSHIAHKILSGFYNNYDPNFAQQQILGMSNKMANQ